MNDNQIVSGIIIGVISGIIILAIQYWSGLFERREKERSGQLFSVAPKGKPSHAQMGYCFCHPRSWSPECSASLGFRDTSRTSPRSCSLSSSCSSSSRWSSAAAVRPFSDLGTEIRNKGSGVVLQPIMPLDLPVKVRSWELTVYPRSHIRRWFRVTWIRASSNVNVLERRASQLAGRNMSAK